MFEHLLKALPEAAHACRALYDVRTGGYHLPPRIENTPLRLADVDKFREMHPQLQYDCIEAPVADLLYSLVVNTHSGRILETGTSRGFSTCHLAAGARFVAEGDARLVTIDIQPSPHLFFAGSPLEECIESIQADSLRPDLLSRLGAAPFDFMFFDSMHTYAHLSAELARYLPLLKLGGLFALHDTLFFDGLGLVVLAMMASRRVEAVSLPTHRRHTRLSRSPGVSLFRKIASIGTDELLFPDLAQVIEDECKCCGASPREVRNPETIIARTGPLFVDPRYVAHRMHVDGVREERSPALLAPWESAPGKDERR